MTFLGYVVAIVLVVFGFEVLVSGWGAITEFPNVEVKDFILFIQVTMTFVAAIAIAILTATFARSNTRLQAQLNQAVSAATETFRAKLAEQTATYVESLRADLTKSVNESTEKLKADLVKSGDEFRARLGQVVPRQHAAYHAMWAAASQYFRALQKYEDEEQAYPEQELKEAERGCEKAVGEALLALEEDEKAFYRLWQEMSYLKEKGYDRRDTTGGLKSLWRTEGNQLGDQYNALRATFANRIRASDF